MWLLTARASLAHYFHEQPRLAYTRPVCSALLRTSRYEQPVEAADANTRCPRCEVRVAGHAESLKP